MTKLEQFRSVCYTKDRKKREIPEEQGGGSCMEKKIITISREYGSGGRQIGLVAAKKLGMEFYDKELSMLLRRRSVFQRKLLRIASSA